MMPNLSPKKLFLIDACGAIVSAVMLGLVLTRLEPMIGMPSSVLQFLASIACVFAVYSFFFFWQTPANWRLYLRAIALANLSYCLLTIYLVVKLYDQITLLGMTYFMAELIVLLALIVFEWKRSFSEEKS
ncbi:MAG: hypothetical protein ABJH98_13260 [Reichenbachiella sp.]|uniref:hypothetical protein n=1 Tax=Reichenbachiella sp. TaxID=2184521 RepID=UPI0032993F2E